MQTSAPQPQCTWMRNAASFTLTDDSCNNFEAKDYLSARYCARVNFGELEQQVSVECWAAARSGSRATLGLQLIGKSLALLLSRSQ
jgi:hypothetical protein